MTQNTTPVVTVPALQRQLRRGHAGLRFAGGLESAFRFRNLQDTLAQRLILYAVAAILVLMMPAADALLLHPPDALIPEFRAMQFGLMVPALLLGACVTWFARWRHLADWGGSLAVLVLTAGVLFQRYRAAPYGYDVPAELVAVILAGGMLVSGLRFTLLAPMTLIMVLGFAVAEIRAFGPTPAAFYNVYSIVMLAAICAIGGYISEYRYRRDWLRENLLEQLSMQDPLTGFLNSRAFEPLYYRTFAHAVRERRSICVAVFDIDYFKEYNHSYGHSAGDDLIQKVAEAVSGQVHRRTDLMGRIRGEVLVVVWYGHRFDRIEEVLNEILASIRDDRIPHCGTVSPTACVTISAGAVWLPEGFDVRPATALRAAERNLARAKRDGRDRVVFGELVSDEEAVVPISASR